MTEFEIENACNQTPCLCGDIETWHQECYAGKTKSQVLEGMKKAYDIARRKLRARAKDATQILTLRLRRKQDDL